METYTHYDHTHIITYCRMHSYNPYIGIASILRLNSLVYISRLNCLCGKIDLSISNVHSSNNIYCLLWNMSLITYWNKRCQIILPINHQVLNHNDACTHKHTHNMQTAGTWWPNNVPSL